MNLERIADAEKLLGRVAMHRSSRVIVDELIAAARDWARDSARLEWLLECGEFTVTGGTATFRYHFDSDAPSMLRAIDEAMGGK